MCGACRLGIGSWMSSRERCAWITAPAPRVAADALARRSRAANNAPLRGRCRRETSERLSAACRCHLPAARACHCANRVFGRCYNATSWMLSNTIAGLR
ncbi:hypothetical protein XCV3633 [Xanthomonas euvesicatoria pv. vesicatoria str. 85-10]|uniref:Uncharacterized protein n=1 Tax=Xanthomonas euvesicatoria pv. vesicatoria (strain 85-10) TaxID=316273 RepID=Q3BPE9_XANE5|nr:hypothetical protein XCV3633 [Xanthomonas euvesicatoria pv. vesicatoria str. 85-10]